MITEYGKFVRSLRAKKRINLSQMAEIVGVTVVFLSNVENGKKNVSKPLRAAVIKIFELSESQIFALDYAIELSILKPKIDLANKDNNVKILVNEFKSMIESGDLSGEKAFKAFHALQEIKNN